MCVWWWGRRRRRNVVWSFAATGTHLTSHSSKWILHTQLKWGRYVRACLCVCKYVCACACVRVCVCVSARTCALIRFPFSAGKGPNPFATPQKEVTSRDEGHFELRSLRDIRHPSSAQPREPIADFGKWIDMCGMIFFFIIGFFNFWMVGWTACVTKLARLFEGLCTWVCMCARASYVVVAIFRKCVNLCIEFFPILNCFFLSQNFAHYVHIRLALSMNMKISRCCLRPQQKLELQRMIPTHLQWPPKNEICQPSSSYVIYSINNIFGAASPPFRGTAAARIFCWIIAFSCFFFGLRQSRWEYI